METCHPLGRGGKEGEWVKEEWKWGKTREEKDWGEGILLILDTSEPNYQRESGDTGGVEKIRPTHVCGFGWEKVCRSQLQQPYLALS